MAAMELRNIKEKPLYAVLNIPVNNNDCQVILMAMNFYYSSENEYQLKNEYIILTRSIALGQIS